MPLTCRNSWRRECGGQISRLILISRSSDINAWVAAATRGRIRDLVHPDEVTNKMRATLVNAIYWKGRWQETFDAGNTHTGPFTALDGHRRPTQLMRQRSDFSLVERDGVQAIDLPCDGNEVSMVVFLPRSSHGLSAFEAGLTDRKLSAWLSALDADQQPRDTVLTLPKMHLQDRYKLAKSLTKMGA
ncbi:MAG TPA: serpin family protein, partial [Caulobacteraceae bacterium]